MPGCIRRRCCLLTTTAARLHRETKRVVRGTAVGSEGKWGFTIFWGLENSRVVEQAQTAVWSKRWTGKECEYGSRGQPVCSLSAGLGGPRSFALLQPIPFGQVPLNITHRRKKEELCDYCKTIDGGGLRIRYIRQYSQLRGFLLFVLDVLLASRAKLL